ncbi:uncharacterized protein LY89DRAFT_738142 [Mollisia scopiformis]|uniref:Clr5 domain-containing protein n=1 Tax=Mollisia scopiformis TaxID=149040 RepID=A0A194WXE2_MOLSC|nr:uncharacterized protein LY89DRAFT_738142 [Mollisia scopiformis]KUJ12354.1 hypothetical protein LY89DRAFT_738142 [Mollisia scopiformis]
MSDMTSSETGSQMSTLDRNNVKWEVNKNEIRFMYMDQDKNLTAVMTHIESVHGFFASARKWKMKLKEWGFEKNIPAKEIGIMAKIAEKRKREEGKETSFERGGLLVPQNKLDAFKKRKRDDAITTQMQEPETPPNITYHTPRVIEEMSEVSNSTGIPDEPGEQTIESSILSGVSSSSGISESLVEAAQSITIPGTPQRFSANGSQEMCLDQELSDISKVLQH